MTSVRVSSARSSLASPLRAASALCLSLAFAACGAPMEPDAGDAAPRSDSADVSRVDTGTTGPEPTPVQDAAADTSAFGDATADAELDVAAMPDVVAIDDAAADASEPMDTGVAMDAMVADTGVSMDAMVVDTGVAMDARTDTGVRVDSGVVADGGCPAGFADCDRNPLNGCEARLDSLLNCGTCGTACVARPNSRASCTGGACAYTCSANFGDCDRNAANGCETPTDTVLNCGRCGNTCSGATPLCDSNRGSCVASCPAGTTRCGGTCVNLQTDPTHCGTCATVCSYANASATCNVGMCQIASCNAGFANCDGNAGNGCENNLNTNANNCGACGTMCPNRPNSAPLCSAGTCSLRCDPSFANCDGNAGNGCETNVATSLTSCGACGVACSYPNANAACNGGACTFLGCSMGFGNCDAMQANGCETPLSTTSNCGMCGSRCVLANATAACAMGRCAVGACTAGFGNCDGIAANGCETTLGSVTNCRACGDRCVVANGTPDCRMNTCVVATCNAGFGDCDRNAGNGCETNTRTSNSHCGACGFVCPGGLTCMSGVCR
jgi:hypothetical protein